MGRLTRPTEYYVRIDPRRLGSLGVCSVPDSWIESDEYKQLVEYKELCEDMIDQIKRHVDGIGWVGVEEVTEDVCEFCGYNWTEGDDSPHNGGCCAKDGDVYEALEGNDNV